MIKSMPSDSYRFQLHFKGELVEDGVDAYDVANTILASSKVLEEIAEINYGTDTSNKLTFNIQAFKKGSLQTDFLIKAVNTAIDNSPALIPLASQIYPIGVNILNTFKTYLEIRKALKGEQPAEIKALSSNKFELKVKGDNNNVTFNLNANDLRVLQSKTIEKNTAKIVQPLSKPDSLIEEIDYVGDDLESVAIDKEDAGYLISSEAVQNLNEVKYKGVVTKIDTKAESGYIDMGSRRIPFNYDSNLSQQGFNILVESLKTKIAVYVIGSVTMDYESNPKQIFITNVESEIKLFE